MSGFLRRHDECGNLSNPTDSLARPCMSLRSPGEKRLGPFQRLTDYAYKKGSSKKKQKNKPEQRTGGSSSDSQLIRGIVRLSAHDADGAEHLGASSSSLFFCSPPKKKYKNYVCGCACTPRAPLFSPHAKLPRLGASKPHTQHVWALFRRHGEAQRGRRGQRWLH